MDEISSDRQDALAASQDRLCADALWSIALVTDAQALSADSARLAEMLQQVTRQRRQEAGQVVLESCLPEIRCLAMLLAASRFESDGAVSPARFTDEADWLAARIQILALSHVEVTLEQMATLDLANRRLQRLCATLQQRAMQALPVLLVEPLGARRGLIQRGWSRMPLDVLVQSNDEAGSKVVRALRQRSRERLAPLLQSRPQLNG